MSETFALNELLALEAAGLLAFVAATKPGDHQLVQPDVERLRTPVHVLAEGDIDAQSRELTALVDGRVDALHGYFAHRPAAVSCRTAAELGLPYGFSAHALDVRKIDSDELRLRAAGAACVITCNDDTGAVLTAAGAAVQLLPHGVDTTHFTPRPLPAADAGLQLLAVGRLVAKKGFPVLVEAIAKLDVPARLRIVGEGPARGEIEHAVARYGVGDRVELVGRCTHRELPARYAAAHAVVVPSVVDPTGDRDGLPNVVLEAMACGRPVVASDVSAIARAVRPRSTGVLVPPDDPAALADALRSLAVDDGATCGHLGAGARAMVADEFDLARCATRFVEALETAYG